MSRGVEVREQRASRELRVTCWRGGGALPYYASEFRGNVPQMQAPGPYPFLPAPSFRYMAKGQTCSGHGSEGSGLRKVTGGEAGRLLLKGPERPIGFGCWPGNQETIPPVLKPRSEVAGQGSRKSSREGLERVA